MDSNKKGYAHNLVGNQVHTLRFFHDATSAREFHRLGNVTAHD